MGNKNLEKGGAEPLLSAKAREALSRQLLSPVWEGNYPEVKRLLESGADPNKKNDNDGYTVLCYAAYRGHAEIVKLLLEHGANPDLVDDNWNTSLILAAQENHPEIVKLLLEHGVEPDTVDDDGNTALVLAARENHPEIVKLLLEHGANPNMQNHKGTTSLHNAISSDSPDILAILLEHKGEVDIKSVAGVTPFMLCMERLKSAAPGKSLECLGVLLEHGAEMPKQVTGSKISPLADLVHTLRIKPFDLYAERARFRECIQTKEDKRIEKSARKKKSIYKESYNHYDHYDDHDRYDRLYDTPSDETLLSYKEDRDKALLKSTACTILSERYGVQFSLLPNQFYTQQSLENLRKPKSFRDRTSKLYRVVEGGWWQCVGETVEKNKSHSLRTKDFLEKPFSWLGQRVGPSMIDLLTAQGRLSEVFTPELWNSDNIMDMPDVIRAIPPRYLQAQVGMEHIIALANHIDEKASRRIEALWHTKTAALPAIALEEESSPIVSIAASPNRIYDPATGDISQPTDEALANAPFSTVLSDGRVLLVPPEKSRRDTNAGSVDLAVNLSDAELAALSAPDIVEILQVIDSENRKSLTLPTDAPLNPLRALLLRTQPEGSLLHMLARIPPEELNWQQRIELEPEEIDWLGYSGR